MVMIPNSCFSILTIPKNPSLNHTHWLNFKAFDKWLSGEWIDISYKLVIDFEGDVPMQGNLTEKTLTVRTFVSDDLHDMKDFAN